MIVNGERTVKVDVSLSETEAHVLMRYCQNPRDDLLPGERQVLQNLFEGINKALGEKY